MKEREKLSDELMQEAISNCAEEPIHIPCSIQPHGVYIAFDPDTYLIKAISENAAEKIAIDTKAALDKPIVSAIGEDNFALLDKIIADNSLQPIQSTRMVINHQTFESNSHRAGDLVALELEPLPENDISLKDDFFYDYLRKFSTDLRNTQDLQILYNLVVAHVRNITGFDRVKLYRFDHEWNGEVIAENKRDDVTSYLGLMFPASDIPVQARELYTKNLLRIISDITYQPAKIFTDASVTGPIDMTYSTLRSVSPIHVQYLDNMGVSASMSISIVQNGKLWGLIACHHMTPRFISYRVRMVIELMGHIFSSLMFSCLETQNKEEENKRVVLIDRIDSALKAGENLSIFFEDKSDLLLEALNADSVAFRINNKIYSTGHTCDYNLIVRLFEYLQDNNSLSVIQSNEADQLFHGREDLKELKCGLVAVPFNNDGSEYLIWFRDPQNKKITWAGKPEKTFEESDFGIRLTPRKSFELWQETVRNKSMPWSRFDLETGLAVARLILQHEKREAQVANQAKSDFLANMSHELRTPMSAIIGIVNILDKDHTLTSEQRKFVKTLQISSESVLELINDLLDLSKIEANKIELESIPFNLAEIVEEVIDVMNVKAEDKQIQLNAKLPDRSKLEFMGDPGRLRQVLFNLLTNAIKFTNEGFVNILIKLYETKIDNIKKITIDVSDTGIGIAQNRIDKIFEKFIQAEESITRQFGGTGLGLAITKSIVELMQGTISISSEVGVGTNFRVNLELPRADMGEHETHHTSNTSYQVQKNDASQTQNTKKNRILLAEDYENNVIVFNYFLHEMGYETVVVNNGRQAIDMIKEQDFDLVLMDVKMPGIDGLEATKIIRSLQKNNSIKHFPIVGMSAHAFINFKEKCYEAGMDTFLTKPFSLNDLKKMLDTYLKDHPN